VFKKTLIKALKNSFTAGLIALAITVIILIAASLTFVLPYFIFSGNIILWGIWTIIWVFVFAALINYSDELIFAWKQDHRKDK